MDPANSLKHFFKVLSKWKAIFFLNRASYVYVLMYWDRKTAQFYQAIILFTSGNNYAELRICGTPKKLLFNVVLRILHLVLLRSLFFLTPFKIRPLYTLHARTLAGMVESRATGYWLSVVLLAILAIVPNSKWSMRLCASSRLLEKRESEAKGSFCSLCFLISSIQTCKKWIFPLSKQDWLLRAFALRSRWFTWLGDRMLAF